jgi:hypothetical protein
VTEILTGLCVSKYKADNTVWLFYTDALSLTTMIIQGNIGSVAVKASDVWKARGCAWL